MSGLPEENPRPPSESYSQTSDSPSQTQSQDEGQDASSVSTAGGKDDERLKNVKKLELEVHEEAEREKQEKTVLIQSLPHQVITIPTQDLTLKRAKNAWKPPAKTLTSDDPAELLEQDLLRKVRAILNKLTPRNFQLLIPQFAELEMTTESRLRGTIKIVFENAINEPSFSFIYASLCKQLGQLKAPSEKDPAQMVVFRNLLVVHCKIEFQKDKADELEHEEKRKAMEEADTPEKKKELKNELDYASTQARRRSYGNIRFIGELFKLGILNEKVMHDCVHKLLKAKDEESLECLCGLLATIGKKIDQKNGTKLFDQYFQRMESILTNRPCSSRVKFMLRDVIDLRRNSWVLRPDNKGPKMISKVQREKQEKTVLTQSLPHQAMSIPFQDLTLKRAKKAWKPPAKTLTSDDPAELQEQDLFRKVRGILNKLTPQNFQKMIPQFAELEITTESRLRGTIKIVFENGINEPSFSFIYASLCKQFGQLKAPSEKDPAQMLVFRNLLVVQCQIEFKKDKADELEHKEKRKAMEEADTLEKKMKLKNELDYASTQARRRSYGNACFIGELFKVDFLLDKIMHQCVHKLLKAKDEESLECLCGLLTTIGKKIDQKKGTKLFDQYFQRMESILTNRPCSSRVKFMLRDVIDLRRNKWVPRHDNKGPKMISEVHEEAERKKREKILFIQRLLHQQDKRRGGMPNRGSQGGAPQMTNDGWTSVSKRAPQMDPKRMNIRINKVDSGRGGFSWVATSKPSSQEAEKSSAPSNRYSALSGADADPRGRGSSATRSSMPPPSNPKSGGRLSQGRDSRGRNISRASREHDRPTVASLI